MTGIIDNIFKKTWTGQDVANFIGEYQGTYLAYATDEAIRLGGASGGVVTSMLQYALSHKIIDGALVCRTKVWNRQVRPEFFIARTPQELLSSQGSKYIKTDFIHEAIPLIEEFEGKLGVVGLPCDLFVLTNKIKNHPELKDKIILTISLFCGHNSYPTLIDKIISLMLLDHKAGIKNFRFRIGHWRGNTLIKLEDGSVITKKYSFLNLYQNLFFFVDRKCLSCHDHFGYYADICAGDIWAYRFKRQNIKYSCLIAKTRPGKDILITAAEHDFLKLSLVSPHDVLDGQSRTAPFHYNISARSRVAKYFDMSIPDKVKQNVKWHEYVIAWIILFNYKWSRHPWLSGLIFKIPRFILKIYLYAFKGLESLT